MGGVYNSLNLNPYAYAYHNPVKYIDPDGKATWVEKNDYVKKVDRDAKGKLDLGIYRVGDVNKEYKLGETFTFRLVCRS